MHQTVKELGADFLLLLVAIAWGSTFFIVQDAVSETPVYTFLFWRFLCAGLFMAFVSIGYRNALNRSLFKAGILLGLFMFLGYAFQTFALTYTYSSTVGFITGLNVVVVPFASYLLFKHKASLYSVVGAITASIGLYYLTHNNSIGLSLGEVYAFICAVMFALHIAVTDAFSKKHHVMLLVSIQFLTVAFCSGIGGLVMEGTVVPQRVDRVLIEALLITVLFATIFAFWVQTAMQRFTTAAKTAIIFTMEPVSAGVFGYWFADEVLSWLQLLGAGLIVLGMLIAELGSYVALQLFRKKHLH